MCVVMYLNMRTLQLNKLMGMNLFSGPGTDIAASHHQRQHVGNICLEKPTIQLK